MTRSRNRRRRFPPLPPTPAGTFQPKEHPVDSTDQHSNNACNGTDRSINSSDHRHDAADPQINGGEYHPAANANDRRFECTDRGPDNTGDGIERRSHGPHGNGRRSQGHDGHCHHGHQRWESKESKGHAAAIAKELGKDEGSANTKTQEYTVYMAARAKELKEEGNRRFQRNDYSGAMEQYELALKLTPHDHPHRAIFHSNRAACLMQMKPVQYDAAIHECNLALEAHPGFGRALLRRARALEAVGKLELALQDVQLLLQGEVSHPDALDMAKRIRLSIGNQGDEAQQDMPSTPVASSDARTSMGASNVASCSSEASLSTTRSFFKEGDNLNSPHEEDNGAVLTPCPSSRQVQTPPRPSSQQMQTPPNEHLPPTAPFNPSKAESLERVIHQDNIQVLQIDTPATSNIRPLKLIYDHDIRLAEMPVNCKFGDLRKLVRNRFPSSKAILIKYKDVEGDLVTITSTEELRLAEAAAAIEAARRNLRVVSRSVEGALSQDQHENLAIGLPLVPAVVDQQLRLHVVEVPAEQEPYDKEEVALMDVEESAVVVGDKTETSDSKASGKGKAEKGQAKGKEEFDKWLLDFAHLFQAHLGIDPNGHVDLHDRGMELCAEALEETVTTEEAHKLLELAAGKFQEMAALGFLNWGNVYMCAARKQLPHDSDDGKMDFCDRLQAAFNWAQAQYALAEEKFEQSLHVKPDFCDAMLGLGQKDFESAKLHWSLAVASQKDLSIWDSSGMLELFCSAEERMQRAAEMLEKQEGCVKDAKTSTVVKREVENTESQGSGDAYHEGATLEQDVALKSQIYLFWGNILYEHSQVEFRLGLPSWKELLDAAVEKFEVAGASSSDITTAIQKHLSSSTSFLDAMDATEGSAQQQDSVPEGEKTVESEENGGIPTAFLDAMDATEGSAQQQDCVPEGKNVVESEENGGIPTAFLDAMDATEGSAQQQDCVPEGEKPVESEENAGIPTTFLDPIDATEVSAQQQDCVPEGEKTVESEENAASPNDNDHLNGMMVRSPDEKHVSVDDAPEVLQNGFE